MKPSKLATMLDQVRIQDQLLTVKSEIIALPEYTMLTSQFNLESLEVDTDEWHGLDLAGVEFDINLYGQAGKPARVVAYRVINGETYTKAYTVLHGDET